jgi:hypothetical protein
MATTPDARLLKRRAAHSCRVLRPRAPIRSDHRQAPDLVEHNFTAAAIDLCPLKAARSEIGHKRKCTASRTVYCDCLMISIKERSNRIPNSFLVRRKDQKQSALAIYSDIACHSYRRPLD